MPSVASDQTYAHCTTCVAWQGGMLAAWLRMKYPNIVDGALAASAPIWSFPSAHPPLDGFGRVITRAVSGAGGATDLCRDNLIATFPLINEAGKSSAGRALLSDAFQTCKPLQSLTDISALLYTAQKPWLYMAEGNYPFRSSYRLRCTSNHDLNSGLTDDCPRASTEMPMLMLIVMARSRYIPFSLGKGETPLPAWPMRVACSGGLGSNLGVTLAGNHSDVRFSIVLGRNSTATVDWDRTAT
jgi:lysosomal Pro-X carboxypeptidase